MRPWLRRLVLTAHVISSVGWIGALVTFLVLAIAIMTSPDLVLLRGAVLSMQVITWWAVIPLSLTALATGVIQSLGTPWGLFRHYWVLFKLVLTLLGVGILALYTRTVAVYADLARDDTTAVTQLQAPTFLIHGSGGLIVLVAATILAIYKPKGLTPYGQRVQQRPRTQPRRPDRAAAPGPVAPGL